MLIKTRPNSRKLINNVLRDTLPVVLTRDRVGQDNLVDECAHGPLEAPMTLVIIWTGESGREPRRLRIGHLGQRVRRKRLDLRFLAFERADLQARVLRTVEHFLPMQAEERSGGVFPRCLVS
jgi:hypothetical protein